MWYSAKTGTSFEALAQQHEGAASAVGRVASTADSTLNELASPEVVDNLRRVTGSLAKLLEQIERGESVAHQLMYDEASGKHFENVLVNLDHERSSRPFRLRRHEERTRQH